jgi:transcriptional regulator with XRE-family HTH domain
MNTQTRATAEAFAEKLEIVMIKEKITRAELARRTGLTRATINGILAGSVNFEMRTIITIAHALGYGIELKVEQGTNDEQPST